MTRAMRFLILALLATPPLTFVVYRLAKGLGFLDPPVDRQHELRRTILTAVFAFVLCLPTLLFGFANSWPRVWWIFGMLNAVALVAFAWTGGLAARRLWKLRHPAADSDEPASPYADDAGGKPLS